VARSLHVLARGVQIDDHSGVISDEARILFGERQLLKNQAVARPSPGRGNLDLFQPLGFSEPSTCKLDDPNAKMSDD
jgi:hypothetical protein